jgi:hypothetical protein
MHTLHAIVCLAEDLSASHDRLCSTAVFRKPYLTHMISPLHPTQFQICVLYFFHVNVVCKYGSALTMQILCSKHTSQKILSYNVLYGVNSTYARALEKKK